MLPLQSIAMGLVVIALTARMRGYDVLADPAGWVLVLVGVRGLKEAGGGLLFGAAVLASAISVVLWFPASQSFLDGQDPSLRWAANLPQLGFVALLCHHLARRSAVAGDVRAVRWLRTALVLTAVVAVLPVLVFGGELVGLEELTYVAAGFALLLVIWLLFAYGRRPWAAGPGAPTRATER